MRCMRRCSSPTHTLRKKACAWRALPLVVNEAGRDHGRGTLALAAKLPNRSRLSGRFHIATWWHQNRRS
jgi:hypothetical protein